MKLIAVALAALLVTSCSSFRAVISDVNDSGALVSPVVSLVTAVIFDKAVSEEDRVEKAKIVAGLADKLIALDLTSKPSREDFEGMLADYLPAKTHWVTLTSLLGTQYEKATKSLSDDDIVKTVAVIKEISFGLKSVTAYYLD